MANQHTAALPVSELTGEQMLRLILREHRALQHDLNEWRTDMAEQLDRLSTAVNKELADDSAQNELIAELRRQLEAAQAAAADAVAGKEGAEQALTAALDAAQAAAVQLESNDPAVEEPPVDPEGPPVDPPVDPEGPGVPEPENPQA